MSAAGPPRQRWMRWWLPSVGTVLWLTLFLGILLTEQRNELINTDADPCWHLRLGLWMMEEGRILREEPFSHTALRRPVLTHDWGSELIWAAAWKGLGWGGVALVAAGLIATCLVLLLRQLLAESDDLFVSALLVLVAALACSVHWVARPLLLSHLLTVLWNGQLRAHDQGRMPARALFVRLPVLMVLWVNLHGAFVIGFALIAMYGLGSLWEWWAADGERRRDCRRKVGVLAGLLGATVLTSLLNPNGWRLLVHVARFLGTPLLKAVTPEFSSPDFHSTATRGFVLWLLILGGLWCWGRPRLAKTELLLLGGWLFLSLHSVRNVPIFALVAAPILAAHLTALLREQEGRPRIRGWLHVSGRCAKLNQQTAGTAWALAAVALLVWAIWRGESKGDFRSLHTALSAERFPVDAVRFVRDHPGIVQGNLFNEYDWGGYLLWALSEQRVFVDGRNDFYGEQLMREYLQVHRLGPDWERVLERYGVGWVMIARGGALANCLALHPGWERVYTDALACVFVRRQASFAP